MGREIEEINRWMKREQSGKGKGEMRGMHRTWGGSQGDSAESAFSLVGVGEKI